MERSSPFLIRLKKVLKVQLKLTPLKNTHHLSDKLHQIVVCSATAYLELQMVNWLNSKQLSILTKVALTGSFAATYQCLALLIRIIKAYSMYFLSNVIERSPSMKRFIHPEKERWDLKPPSFISRIQFITLNTMQVILKFGLLFHLHKTPLDPKKIHHIILLAGCAGTGCAGIGAGIQLYFDQDISFEAQTLQMRVARFVKNLLIELAGFSLHLHKNQIQLRRG